MRRSSQFAVRIAFAAVLVATPGAVAADARFDLPRVTVTEASPASSRARIIDEETGRRSELALGDRYADQFLLVSVKADRIVLRRLGADAIYYVLPVTDHARAGPRSRPAEIAAAELAPLDPYAEPRAIRRVIAPQRAHAAPASADLDDAPAPLDPYDAAPPTAPGEDAADGDERAESRQLSRAELDDALADLQALEQTIAIHSGPEGLRITALAAGSFIHRLGLRRGDLVRRVAGRSLASMGAAAALYAHLARTDEVAVEIIRGEQSITLRYHLVP